MNSDVLLNYCDDDGVATSARVFIVIVVFSTFAICQFVGRYVQILPVPVFIRVLARGPC